MFGRKRRDSGQADVGRPIAEFWRWWAGARDRIAAAIEAGDAGALAGEIGDRIQAIDPALEWELTPGRDSRHAIVVSPVGSSALRRVVAEWLAGAPEPDATWSYYGSRQPDPNVLEMRLVIDDQEIELADLRFGATLDENHACLDVEVYHPDFATMAPDARLRIAFMSLDWVLGEDRVELWVGPIEAVTAPSPAQVPAAGMVSMIDELVEKHREPQWVLMSGLRDNVPMMATAQRPLKGIRWPRFDTHVAVNLPYADRGNGFPTDESLERIRAAEDYLVDVIGSAGELLAHETTAGVRTLHFYVEGSTDAAGRLTTGVRTFRGKAESRYDPDLGDIKHLA
jgi:hypothetical protein